MGWPMRTARAAAVGRAGPGRGSDRGEAGAGSGRCHALVAGVDGGAVRAFEVPRSGGSGGTSGCSRTVPMDQAVQRPDVRGEGRGRGSASPEKAVVLCVEGTRLAIEPQLSGLLARKEHARTTDLYQTATRWLMTAGYVIFIIFPVVVLGIFGHRYTAEAASLVVLSVAMLVSLGVGNVTVVLLMGGKSSWNMVNACGARCQRRAEPRAAAAHRHSGRSDRLGGEHRGRQCSRRHRGLAAAPPPPPRPRVRTRGRGGSWLLRHHRARRVCPSW